MVPMRPSGAQECARGVQEPLCWSQHGMGWNEIDYSKFMSDPPTQEPQGIQNQSWRFPKSRSGMSSRAKMHTKDASDQSRGAQECPRGAQEALKSAQEMTKRRLRGPRRLQTLSKIKPGNTGMRPGRVGVRSGSTWRTYLRKKRSPKPLRTSFVLFFRWSRKT